MSFANEWVYTEIVEDHFTRPRNVWKRNEKFDANGIGEVGSLACGDQMRVGIIVENDKIKDIRWLTYGCASAIASTSMMSEMVKGMGLKEAYEVTPKKINAALGGLPSIKFHCSVLGDKALRAAIDDYLEKNNLPNPYRAQVAQIICECKGVTDQQIEQLVKDGKVKNLDELREITQYGTSCGKCKDKVASLFSEYMHIYGKA